MKQFHQKFDVRNSMNTQINISITYFFCSQFISFCTRPQLWLSHNRSCPATSTANFLSQARHLKNFLQLFLQLLYWCSWSKAYYFSGRHPYANKQSPRLQCACATALLKPFLLLWHNLKWQKISISKWNHFAICSWEKFCHWDLSNLTSKYRPHGSNGKYFHIGKLKRNICKRIHFAISSFS